MKDYKKFIRSDSVFDAKAFIAYNTQLFDAFRDQIGFLGDMGLPGGAEVKAAFDELDSELKLQSSSDLRLETLSEKFSRFCSAADSFTAGNLGSDQETMNYIMSANKEVDGEVCTFSEFLYDNNFSAAGLNNDITQCSSVRSKVDEADDLHSGFSLFADEPEEANMQQEEKKHPNVVPDSRFPNTPRNKMQRMANDAPIFPHGVPDPRDVLQDENGSCFMLGTLWSAASKRPQIINDLITDNKDGTVTVHFFKDGSDRQPRDVTVEKSLPNTDIHSAPWVRLIEKAYMASELKVNQAANKTEPISMDGLGWYDAGEFMKNILPQRIQSVNPEAEILSQPDFNASKQKFADMLRAAQNSDSVVTITSEKHVMGFKGLSEKNGKTYVNYYDQYSQLHDCSISLDDLFSPASKLDMINVTGFDADGNPVYQGFAPRGLAKSAQKLNEPLTKERFASIFKVFYKDQLSQDIKDVGLSGDPKGNGVISQFDKTKAVDTMLYSEFTKLKLSNLKTRDYLKMLDTPNGQNYKKALLDRIEETFIVDAHTNAPDKAQSFRDIREVFGRTIKGDPAGPPSNNEHKDPPKKEEEKVRTEAEIREDVAFQEVASCLDSLETLRKGRTNNSPEFVAMTEAIRDLSYARKNGVPKERLEQLELRAYTKCKYYEDHKNPYSAEGRQRKWLANTVRERIAELNPSVVQALGKKASAELACAEIAAHLADDMIKRYPESFRVSPDSQSVDENLRAKLVDQWSRNSELKKFAADMKIGTAEDFLGKMCEKGMPELLTKAVTKSLLEPMTQEKVEISAKEKKAVEVSFGIRSGGLSR